MTPDTFTTGQAAKICGVSIMTLKRWLAKGEMAGYRLPGSGDWRITRDELRRFMERNDMPVERLEAGEPKRRILVAEDQPELLEYVRTALLPDSRLEVQCMRTTGFEACLSAGLLKPDLVVIGLLKSSSDGFQLARTIRKHPAMSETKVLFTNGCNRPECLRNMKALGHSFLLRPVEKEQLISAIYHLTGLPRT